MMNNSTLKRSEAARLQAQAAMSEAKRRQDELLQERAASRASEIEKIEGLRAKRLAQADKAGGPEIAAAKPAPVKRRRLSIAA